MGWMEEGRFDGINKTVRMKDGQTRARGDLTRRRRGRKEGEREGMRFIVLIPFSNECVTATLCGDLLF